MNLVRSVLSVVGLCLLASAALAQTNVESSRKAIDDFVQWAKTAKSVSDLTGASFSSVALTREDSETAARLLWDFYAKTVREAVTKEWQQKSVTIGKHTMRFDYRVFGKKPAKGWDLYISMHGGGGAPARVNDQQWRNQIGLYQPKQGIYLAPRAPTNTWNLWHQGHIDGLFARIIEGGIIAKDVNPDRIYLMGYSAGGDGVYQLAPRMADRFAAAAMMAGHPNETSPLGLRNIPFTLHMGGKDAAYDRNKIAAQWKEKLAALQKKDKGGYVHEVVIHKGLGHWMNRKDAVAVPWMAKFSRKADPERVVWKQDDVTHARFYWLGVPGKAKARSELNVLRQGQEFRIESAAKIGQVEIYLRDGMVDCDRAVKVTMAGKTLFEGKVTRSLGCLAKSLLAKKDPKRLYAAELKVTLPAQAEESGSQKKN